MTPSWEVLDCTRFLIYKDKNKNYVYIREQAFYDGTKIHVYINRKWKIINNKLKRMEKYIFLNQQGYSEYKLESDEPNIKIEEKRNCNIL